MEQQITFTTKEAAERLNVHARTVRKWIDAFPDFVRPESNSRGHYQISEDGLEALQTIQNYLKKGNYTLKQVREMLVKNGLLDVQQVHAHTSQNYQELTSIRERLTELEKSHQNTMQLLKQLKESIDGIRQKQDQLKLEIRQATFDMRLNAAEKPKRKKGGILRLSQLFR